MPSSQLWNSLTQEGPCLLEQRCLVVGVYLRGVTCYGLMLREVLQSCPGVFTWTRCSVNLSCHKPQPPVGNSHLKHPSQVCVCFPQGQWEQCSSGLSGQEGFCVPWDLQYLPSPVPPSLVGHAGTLLACYPLHVPVRVADVRAGMMMQTRDDAKHIAT